MQKDFIKSEINRISSEVSSRICTAQVVVTLNGAARQLIDNALDAGAKTIDIRVKNNGFDSLEVVDDGCGIEMSNFSSLCKPHSTSKLTVFSDFNELSTLGFRGEALNALCALGSVTIITRSEVALLGTKLIFDHSGSIVEQSNVARPVGTTVLVDNLFETLPVRRKEFERVAKREYSRLLTTVQSFALSRPDVKFICGNTICGKRHQSICTNGKVGIREVVINLFGGRLDKNKMLDILKDVPNEDVCAIYGLDPNRTDSYKDIELSGFISSCEHGFGRSSSDRQFIYVNQRPVDYPKICRVVNEIYQQYNRSQYPTLVLFIQVPSVSIDVNITPDKRTVFFDREKELLALIRSSVIATFQPMLGTYTSVEDKIRDDARIGNLSSQDLHGKEKSPLSTSVRKPLTGILSLLKESGLHKRTTEPLAKRVCSELSKNSSSSVFNKKKSISEYMQKSYASRSMQDTLLSSSVTRVTEPTINLSDKSSSEDELEHATNIRSMNKSGSDSSIDEQQPSKPSSNTQEKLRTVIDNVNSNLTRSLVPSQLRHNFTRPLLTNMSRGFDSCLTEDDEALQKIEITMDKEDPKAEDLNVDAATISQLTDVSNEEITQSRNEYNYCKEDGTFLRTQQTIPFSATRLAERMQNLKSKEVVKFEQASQEVEFIAIIKPDDNEKAEMELDRVLKKSNFAEMSVIGQFNNGFIITKLRHHLFIIDQHASDEKFNFERFQKKARVENQRLISAQALNLGAVQEAVLRDNIDIFRANGFDFEFRESEEGVSQAYLTSVPVLHSWQFDRNDIDEILSMVNEYPGVLYRPAKLRRIFASRACRKSVMIGTALTKAHMETIVRHLGTLDQPWNCPHGRPTLRHLADLRSNFGEKSISK